MIVGMDFGTTNSGMAVYDGHQLRLIPLDPTSPNPSVARSALYITNDRTIHVGRDAIETYYQQNLGRPSKYERVQIGEIELTFAELPTFVREIFAERDIYSPGRLFLSFKMGLSSTNYLGTLVGSHYYYLEHIIATYLYLTRKRAEAYLNTELDTIVLGRPVRYSDDPDQNNLARERLLQAAFRAGYKTVYLEYEPVAAAHYYETFIDREQNVLIFDFGGGTLDISILRLGNPQHRQVLANGGIPIAGDVFDQKIVRAKLPPHLGEGETYHAGRDDLPIPSSYYNAFSNWQDLLALQQRERLEMLQRIERTARSPQKIHMLIKLIQSNYGIKLFDLAEAGKRQVSTSDRVSLLFNGPGFTVHETLTRAEFENLIRSNVRAITQRLNAVINAAGLRDDQIDAVIRTGGSSQIPAFINLLEQRFGAEKVRDIDTFSSVTAGLGILAHQVQRGEVGLTAHTPETNPDAEYLKSKKQGGVPVIDLDLLKRLIDLRENKQTTTSQSLVILTGTAAGRVNAARYTLTNAEMPLDQIGLLDTPQPPVEVFAPDENVLLMTTEFHFLLRSVAELADLTAANLDFTAIENFHRDAFGRETVCAVMPWSAFQKASSLLVMNTRGYGRVMAGEQFINRLNQRLPYYMEKGRGYPGVILPVRPTGEVILVTHAGRALRIAVKHLPALEERLLQLPAESRLIGAFYLERPHDLLIATASGYGQRLKSSDIPLTTDLNTTGVKIITRTQPVVARLHEPGKTLRLITNQRVACVPLPNDKGSEPYRLLPLKPNESLVSAFYSA